MAADTQLPPQARQVPKKLTKHRDSRVDNYYWLRERENPEVIKYLQNENSYATAKMTSTEALQQNLIKEFRQRIKEDDESAMLKRGPYSYFSRYLKGAEYPIYLRKKNNSEEVLIDVNELAKGHAYYDVARVAASPDHSLIVFAVDTVGRRFYDLQFKEISTKKIFKFKIENTSGDVIWLNDNRTLLYIKQDPITLRDHQVYKFTLPNNLSEVETLNFKPRLELVYEEKNDKYYVSVSRALTQNEVYITSNSKNSSETQIASADDIHTQFKIFLKRKPRHEYEVIDGGDRYFVLTNDKAKNFRLIETPKNKTDKKYWRNVYAHNPKVLIENVVVFKNHLVLQLRENGLAQIAFTSRKQYKFNLIQYRDPTYVAELGHHAEYDSSAFRYVYESLTQPETTYDYDFATQNTKVVKTLSVPTYDASQYESHRVYAKAHHGVKLPISILYKSSLYKKNQNPILITAYGSYGMSSDPYFRSSIVSLLDRGFVFAIAHVRGGSEMGRKWYDDGKLLKKKNTFKDFITCTEYLIKNGYGKSDLVFANGGSAGGLLMGAVINMRPDLYKAVVADVPFVDVLTTMLDESIPLTTHEYEEWGNPNIKKYYNYIKSYSPYDNIKKQKYPHILAVAGLHDSQVQYWEPAKWVAKLRDNNVGENIILLKTDMTSGHSGTTGRFDSLKEVALNYAFYLMFTPKD